MKKSEDPRIMHLKDRLMLNDQLGQYSSIIATKEKILSVDPNDLGNKADLANCYDTVGRHEEANALIADMIENQPDSWAPYYAKGMVDWRHGDEKAAKKNLNRSFELAKDEAERECSKLGLAIVEQDWEQLLLSAEYVRVRGVNAPGPDAMRFVSYFYLNLPRKAAKEIDSFIDTYPDHSFGYFWRALVEADEKNFVDAERDMTGAIEASIQIPGVSLEEPLMWRGLYRVAQGKTLEAIDDFNSAIAFDSNNGLALFGRSGAYLTKGENELAWQDIRKAVDDLGLWVPSAAEHAINIGLILNHDDFAKRWVKRARKDYPDEGAFVVLEAALIASGKNLVTETVPLFFREALEQGYKLSPKSPTVLMWSMSVADNDGNKELVSRYRRELSGLGIPENVFNGEIPTNSMPTLEDVVSDPSPNIFRHEENHWIVRFNGGKTFTTMDQKGLGYIAMLVMKPREVLFANQMVMDTSSGVEIELKKPEPTYGNEESQRRSDTFRSRSPSLDKKMSKEYQNALEIVEEKFETCLDPEKKEELQHQIRKIKSLLIAGRHPDIDPDDIKNANSVRNAIRRAIEKLQDKDTILADHLRNSIKCGLTVMYRPDQERKWST